MKQETRKTTDGEHEALEFLNDLRIQGITNMFGATEHIRNELGHDKVEAKRLLMLWMSNFNKEGNYETINI